MTGDPQAYWQNLARAHMDKTDRLEADLAAAQAREARVRALHAPFGIYDECAHNHTDEDVEAGRAVDTGYAYSCRESLAYYICAECCTHDAEMTETCADYHKHGKDQPVCPTVRALDGTDGGA